VRKIKIAAHSEKEYIFSGEKTPPSAYITQLLQKEKYNTQDCPLIPSPGVKINYRPHSTLPAKDRVSKHPHI